MAVNNNENESISEAVARIILERDHLCAALTASQQREAELAGALEPLKLIADAFNANGLDEARPDWATLKPSPHVLK